MGNMSRMAKFVVILLIVTIASFAIAGIIFFSEYGGNLSSINEDTFKPSGSIDVDEVKTQSVDGISKIYVNTSSDDIHIIKTDSNELKARFHGYYSTNSKDYKPEFTLTSGNGEIRVRVDYKSMVGLLLFNSNLKLDVYLPAGYSKNLDVESTSADITTDGIEALESFVCKSTSGSIEAGSVNAGTAKLETTSGDASVAGKYGSFEFHGTSGSFSSEGVNADTASLKISSGSIQLKGTIGDLKLGATSGEVSAEQITAKTCDAETSSGSITLVGNPGKVNASASSGSILLEYDEYASDITAKTSSGSVFIKLPQDAQFRLDHDTSSGDSKIDFPVTVSGDSDRNGIHGTVVSDRNSIRVSTTSGSLEITK